MKLEFNILVEKLYTRSIDEKEFIRLYFNGSAPSDSYVLNLLESAISMKDSTKVEEGVVLLCTGYFELEYFLSCLCFLLKENWHTRHEDIAMLLKELKSDQTVQCLYDATELQFDYLDYDDTYQFARKCIKALSAIDNESAIQKLKILTNSRISVIGDYAKKELRYKGR